jgi:hypothetical protein
MRIPLLLLALALPATAQAQTRELPKNPGKEPLAAPPTESAAPVLAPSDPVTDALMDRIESTAFPWNGHQPGDYVRYYAWADPKRTVVAAVYVAGPAARGWVAFDDLPDIALMESGCRAISLVYDVQTGTVSDLGCATGA